MQIKRKEIINLIDVLGLFSIAIYVLLSSFFTSNFSESHVQFSFLDFPVFIGEFLLFFLFLLFFYRLYLSGQWHLWYWMWGCYVGWFLILALLGYIQWGPLALRNAALFYYVCFFLLTYTFYNQKFFTSKILAILAIVVMTIAVGFRLVQDYYWYTYLALITVIVFKHTHLIWRCLSLVLIFSFSHMDLLFVGSRAHMVGIVGALVFLVLGSMIVYKISWRLRLSVAGVFLSVLILGSVQFADHNALKSLLNWSTIIDLYKQEKEYISQHRDYYIFKRFSSQVYNPNHSNRTILERSSEKSSSTISSDSVITLQVPLTKQLKPDKAIDPKSSSPQDSIVLLSSSSPKSPLISIIPSQMVQVKTLTTSTQNLSTVTNSKLIPEDSSGASSETVSIKTIIPLNKLIYSQPQESSPYSVFPMSILFTKDSVIRSNVERNLNVANVNILFRLFIWEDMLQDLKRNNAWIGLGFGYPQRSTSLEILGWGMSEWTRDGWITSHNFFLHVIYRAGIIGFFLILGLLGCLYYLSRLFVMKRDINGLILVSVLVYWCIQSTFSVTLELPHYAILFWSLLGMIFAYAKKEKNQ